MVKTKSRGFTLIEMLIVVIVLGATASLVAPSVGRGVARARVRRAAAIVATDLELAFTTAARQRMPVRVTFSPSTLAYQVADRATGDVLMTRSFGAGSDMALSSLTVSATVFDIYPNGTATGPDTINLRSRTHTRRVIVTRAGLIWGGL
jgi:prepilin-type N-terminal cleavage/methylation domain-containing protein